jgi:hypothetical protein
MDFSTGKLEAAKQRLVAALAVQNATDMVKAKELLSKIQTRRQGLANERVKKLVATATESFEAGQFDKAGQTVNQALAVEHATDTESAKCLGSA